MGAIKVTGLTRGGNGTDGAAFWTHNGRMTGNDDNDDKEWTIGVVQYNV